MDRPTYTNRSHQSIESDHTFSGSTYPTNIIYYKKVIPLDTKVENFQGWRWHLRLQKWMMIKGAKSKMKFTKTLNSRLWNMKFHMKRRRDMRIRKSVEIMNWTKIIISIIILIWQKKIPMSHCNKNDPESTKRPPETTVYWWVLSKNLFSRVIPSFSSK